MSRTERKNMIHYIEMIKGFDKDTLAYMTDADIEHIYESTYNQHEMAE
ncbi:BH0509 family protein [Bacillaceae bacterium S4-13-58]